MGAWRNSSETQQSGHAPRSGPKVKNVRSGAEDGGTLSKEESAKIDELTPSTDTVRCGWVEMAGQLPMVDFLQFCAGTFMDGPLPVLLMVRNT